MSTAITRSFVTVTYLLGARGDALTERIPMDVAQAEARLLRGLTDTDRHTRARFLAAGVRELTQEAARRGVALSEPRG